MFIMEKQDVINGIPVRIEQKSKYPLPWLDSKDTRPEDYYSQISTTITYQHGEEEIGIFIPFTALDTNRKRKIQVTVNGSHYPFTHTSPDILDMNKTFDMVEIDKLLKIAFQSEMQRPDTIRVCTPFYCMPTAGYCLPTEKRQLVTKSDGWVRKTNGSIKSLISPFIKAILESPSRLRKELFIPIATYGTPHHWNLCILTIDENNKPELNYLETTTEVFSDSLLFRQYRDFYLDSIYEINAALTENKLQPINPSAMKIDVFKQFSELGCGFSLAVAIQKIQNLSFQIDGLSLKKFTEHFRHSSYKFPETDFSRVTIEEDVMARVVLAFALDKHNHYIEQSQTLVDDKYRYIFEAVLRELKTHPHTLTWQAREAFAEMQTTSSVGGTFFAKPNCDSSQCIKTKDKQTFSFTGPSSGF